MRLLLDTHTFIWYITNNPKLSLQARELIGDGDHKILLSIVSIWEMAIKQSIGKLSFKLPFNIFIQQQLEINDFTLLDVKLNHVVVVADLPLHHRDPFDRLLIAQAKVEEIPIIGCDAIFDNYSIQRLW